MDTSKIISLLGEQSEFLLGHTCKTIDKSLIHIPSPSVIDSIWIGSDRNIQTLNNLQRLLGSGRLANGIRLNTACGPRYRTYGGSFLRSEPDLFRSGKHRQVGY